MKSIATLTIAVAALAAGLCFDVPTSRASYYGDAQWCVMTFGDDVHWDCEFRTPQECLAAAAGSRGGCNVNPYYGGASVPAAKAAHRNGRAQRPRRP